MIARKAYTVETATSLVDIFSGDEEWVESPHLICTQLTRALMPTIDSARLKWRYGVMAREDESELAPVAPLDLVGKFVRISLLNSDPEEPADVVWVGYVTNEGKRTDVCQEKDVGGTVTVYPRGDQELVAVGLEWLLAREPILRTRMAPGDDPDDSTSLNYIWLDRAIGYNTGDGRERDLDGLNRGNRNVSVNTHNDNNIANAVAWNAAQIVKNVLDYHTPRNRDDERSPVPFELAAGADAFLEDYYPTIPTEGRSAIAVLGDAIPRRRGLVWWLEYGGGALEPPTIYVGSTATADLTLPNGGELPMAANTVTLDRTTDLALAQVTIAQDKARFCDQVICRGARRTSTFTVYGSNLGTAPSYYTLGAGWDSDTEDEYADAAIGTTGYGALSAEEKKIRNDRFRQNVKYDSVFRDFILIPNSSDEFPNASYDSGHYICPTIVLSTGSIVGGELAITPGMRVQRFLPLKAGFTYANATTPVAAALDQSIYARPLEMRPFGFYPIGEHDTLTGKFFYLDQMSSHKREDDTTKQYGTSYSLAPSPSTAGVRIEARGGMPHSLAKDVGLEPTQFQPEADWQSMSVTVCTEWDSSCQAEWPAIPDDKELLQKIYVDIGDAARFDWLAKGTVYGLDDDQKLAQVSTAGAVRDDRYLCLAVAQLAYDWYGTPRADVSVSMPEYLEDVSLGDLITTIGAPDPHANNPPETVNATVSQIDYDPEQGRYSLTTGFTELDFAGLV